MRISVQCNMCAVHYLSNKSEDYVTVTAVDVSYVADTLGSNFVRVLKCPSYAEALKGSGNKESKVRTELEFVKAEDKMGKRMTFRRVRKIPKSGY